MVLIPLFADIKLKVYAQKTKAEMPKTQIQNTETLNFKTPKSKIAINKFHLIGSFPNFLNLLKVAKRCRCL